MKLKDMKKKLDLVLEENKRLNDLVKSKDIELEWKKKELKGLDEEKIRILNRHCREINESSDQYAKMQKDYQLKVQDLEAQLKEANSR